MLRLFWVLVEALRGLWPRLCRLPGKAAVALGAAGMGEPARPERLWRAFAIVLPVALFAALVLPKITLVMSPSIDAWAVREAPGPIVRGDYVKFTLRHPIAGPNPVSVTKHALCMPGDHLDHIETPSVSAPHAWDGRYFCNGELLGVSLPYGLHGLRLQHLQWSGMIPPGMVYVGSHHPRGFDSRYFGLVPISRLTRMEKLL
ncbi:S26 family signal peptidase [Sphingobium sp. H39-3-25]|uniref:S26 family signal peptidase n=1 Tax=Sphingomonadales TaxID=204457 RepID=UPI0008326CD2|nr:MULTISPECIES: S26 family signal peptidase [Sphingomonadaceae]MDF0491108.1 S26 family signal peptidase [Sphingomonas pollutisoli]MDF0545161.1 S26 family signal peptidase [Sphingobium arseniciresistens]